MSPSPEEEPAYLSLHASGQLTARVGQAWALLRRCTLCPRECGVDRVDGEIGECRTGGFARVEGYGPHYGEEAPLVGRGGSGTIFFVGCNLACVFCQNHGISQPTGDRLLRRNRRRSTAEVSEDAEEADSGTPPRPRPLLWEVEPGEIARMMLELQASGCENINFVSPSHVVPQILAALVLAADKGLRLPLVYNTGGFDSVETLRLLDGVIDIYMPDMKYGDDRVGKRLSGVSDYAARNREAVVEMHRQVGDLELGSSVAAGSGSAAGWSSRVTSGVARRGLLVRHLVLPNGLAGTAAVAGFLVAEVSPNTYINVMDQYNPAHRAARYPEISRRLTLTEYRAAVQEVLNAGLWRLDGWEVSRRTEMPS